MNRLLQKTFENRKIDEAFLIDMDDSRHSDLKDIDLMCELLYDVYINHEHIVVLPDFDMDGIMSGVTGFAGLSELGFYTSLYLPKPSEGYGFDEDDILDIIAMYPDVKVILTGDVGIACHDGIAFAKKRGIRVLVTDHHLQKKVDANADCIVNPMRLDETYEHPYICGAHVLYQVLMHYAKTYCSQFTQDQIARLCVFAGIGTISDGMLLRYENRELVRNAVSVCKMLYSESKDDFILRCISGCDVYRRCFFGLYTVLSMFSDYGKLRTVNDISEDFFGFYLAPMFNSLKRLNGDMARGFGVFFGSNPAEDAFYLYDLNEERKTTVAEYWENDIVGSEQPFAPFAYFSSAPSGILGLLAQKVSEQTGLPVLVLHQESDGIVHGSGRSPVWYPCLDKLLSNCSVAGGGGHNPAFGVQFATMSDVISTVEFLQRDVGATLHQLPEEARTSDTPDFVIATDCSGDVGLDILLFLDYLSELKAYHPFGNGFARPDILLKFRTSDCVSWSAIGSEKQHLKIVLRFGFSVLVWNRADCIELQESDDWIYLRGHLDLNRFNDMTTVNFIGDFVTNDALTDLALAEGL